MYSNHISRIDYIVIVYLHVHRRSCGCTLHPDDRLKRAPFMQRSLVVPFTISLVCHIRRTTKTEKNQWTNATIMAQHCYDVQEQKKSEKGQNRGTEAKQRDLCVQYHLNWSYNILSVSFIIIMLSATMMVLPMMSRCGNDNRQCNRTKILLYGSVKQNLRYPNEFYSQWWGRVE